MNNKAFIIIGLIICLLFTIPMVSAAEVSADSDLIDNSVIESNINSQAIATSDVNDAVNNIEDINSNIDNINSNIDNINTNIDSNVDADDNGVNTNVSEIDIDDSNDDGDEITDINSGNNKNSNDKNVLGANALTAIGDGNTFTDLKYLIDQAIAGGATSLTLDRDFVFTSGDDDSLTGGIPISSPITIFGASHTIDGSNMARIFDIKSNNVFLNNIVFKNGNASSTDSLGANGGAIYVEAEGTITDYCGINNSTFINCYALKDGGALYIRGDYFTLSNSTFINNTAGDDGGAIDWEGGYGKLYNINASGNSAISYSTSNSKGGTMIITGSNMVIDRVTISNSRAKAEGSGSDHDEIQGGAIFLTGNNVNITNSSFTNCSVEYDGDNASAGALYVIGNDVNIVNCNFTNNSATEYGGALYISGDNVALNNTVFINNTAHNDGGAIQWDGDYGKVYNLTADGNHADSAHGTSKGGTMIIRGSNTVIDKAQITNSYVDTSVDTKVPQGGAIAISGNGCKITNSAFTNCSVKNGNDNSSGGALYIWGNDTSLVGCNFTNNSAIEDGGAIYIEGNDCTLNDTIFLGNVAHNDGGAIEWHGNNGVIYNLTARENYADSAHGSSKGGTMIITGSNMNIDKATITDSYVDGGSSASNVQGGAIFLTGNNANIKNSVFTDCHIDYNGVNSSGGALYILGNFTKVENCNFTGNVAHQDGGAIYISGSDVSVVDSNFVENFASKSGGAIFLIDNKNSQINGSTFKTNVALVNGGAINFYAGAEDGLVSSCEFIDNSAWGAGGSVYWEGTRGLIEYSNFTGSIATGAASSQNTGRGGSVIWLGDRGEMRECIFDNSTSKKEGSALYIIGNDFAAYASNFTNSKSEESSGTIYIQGTYAKIGDCYMDNNTVKEKGAGIFVKGNFISISGTTINNSTSGNAGSAVYVEGNRTEIKNSLISNNKANTSGAVYIAGSRSTVTNVNFENNTAKTSAGAIYISGDDTIVTESNFTNNTAYKGGAILYEGKRITISYSNFTLNRANGTSDAKGGSISIKGKSGDSIIGCNFKDSSSGSSGGSIHWLAGGEGGLIQNCTFINSSTDGISVTGQGHGGAIIWEANTNGVVDNCTFIDCVAKGTKNAGAIYMGTSSSSATNPVITNCVIVNCTNGERGVINIYGINATLENITFTNLTALNPSRTNGFHAIEFENLATGRVINCTFENINGTFDGGAIKVDKGSNIVFAENKFINVNSTRNGGAFYSTSVSGNQIIENNTFINCSSVNQGGALYANNKITSFKNNTFINNSGVNQGGAVYSNTALTVTDSYFESNSADSGSSNIRGGAVYVNSGGMTVDNSTFIANSALVDGGALYAGSNGNIKISNSTFEHNTAGNSGGVLFTGGSAYVNKSSTLMYNNATTGSAIKANSVYINDTVLLENQAHFREWADESHTISSTHATISGTFRGEDNLLNAINANNYAFKNVVYCGINGETTNTDDVTSAKSNNEVYQLIVLEIYNAENELIDTIEQYTDANGHYTFDFDLEDASNYAYKVIHPEDNYYTGAEYTIGKAMSNLTISSQNITHPEDENITFTVTGAGDIPVGNITVLIKDTNGTIIYNDTIILNASAQASITLPRLNATEYYISAKYNGDDNYLPDNETSVFHVDMADSFIIIGAQNYTYNETGNITITVPYIESGKISVIVSNDEGYAQSYTVYVDEGTEEIKFELPILDAGNYTVDALFYGNNNYYPSENTTNFTVFKAASIIDVSANNVSGGERSTVDIHVDPEVATQNVNVTVYDSEGNLVAEYEDLGLLDSRTSITLPVLSKGKYNVTVHYAGDKNHNESDNETIFYVTNDLFPIDIEAINMTYGDDEIINVTVPSNANPDKLWIEVKWIENDESIIGNNTVTSLGYTIDENGIVHIDTADLSNRLNVGNYSINVYYEGDDDFLSNSSSFTFEVVKADVDMTVTPQNITYGAIENITVEIPKLNEIGQNDALTLYVNSTNNESIRFIIENYDIGTDGKAIWNVDNNILPAGEYTVEVLYAGSNNYNPTNRTERFTVSKAAAWIEIEVNNIFVGENEVINITVHPNGENGVTGNVTLYVRDKEVNLTLDENGKATYTLTDEVEGTGITVIAIYNGDNNYNDTRNSTNYNVTKQNTTTVVDALSPIHYGTVEDLNVTVNFTDATGTITLYINSTVDGFNNITKVFTITETDEGKVNWNIDGLILPVGTYDVTAVYSGDRKYNNSTSQIKLIVVEQNEEYEITVVADNTVYGEDEIIIVTVPDDADGTVTISIDGREIETKQVSGGKAIFNVTGLEVHDDYNVTATYNGDANYKAGNTADDLFNVTKAVSHIDVIPQDIAYGQIENITISIPDYNASGKVNITIYNKSDITQVIRTLNDVAISADEDIVKAFEGLAAGNYTVKVEYFDDHNYENSEDTADFEVGKADPTLSENSPDIIYGENENITVTITGVEGGASPTGTIEVKVDGVTVQTIEIGNDLEYIVEKPAVDPRHNVTVIYSGDSNYNAAEITGEFAVSKNDTFELSEDSPNIVYANNETITITLPNDATGTVYLVVNGSYYTPIGIDENHQAVFNISSPLVGEYEFTAYYSGDSNYGAKDIRGAFNVTKADVTLTETHTATISYGEDNTITVSIIGVENGLDPTGTIVVKVDGVEIDNLTIGADELVFTSIKPFVDGQHNITVIYSGDSNYNDKEITGEFAVIKNNTVELSEVSPDINYGENETITVTIAGDATGTITVKLGEETVGTFTIAEDNITEDAKEFTFVVVKPDGGFYDNLSIVYGGDSNYEGKTLEGEFTVSPIEPTITEESPDIVYGADETITITVPEGATGTLTVTVTNSTGGVIIDGQVLTIGTDELQVTITKPNVDDYTISIDYSGCANYTAKTISGEFKVSKADVTLSEISPDIVYGDDETITVSIAESDATGVVEVLVDGVSIANKTIGTDELVFTVTKPGADPAHNITVIYKGDENYNTAEITGEFAVTKNDSYELSEDSPNIVYANNEVITITLPEDATGIVNLFINGFYYTSLNVEDHQAIFTISSPIVGEYSFTASYMGDGNYTAKDIDGAFNVTKANVTLTEVHTPTITYGENNIITVSISGVENGLDPTGTVVVKVDGVEIANKTIGTDELVFTSIKPFVDGQHNITVIYSGDNNYNDKEITGEFEVTQNNSVDLSEDSPDINYGENETITVTIAGDATGTIIVTVGGEQIGNTVSIDEITEDDKVFTFNITKPDGGVYDDLKVVYSGDDNYAGKTLEGEFTVSPIEPDITEESPDIVYTNNETIAITVPEGATGTLTVTVKNSKGETIVDAKVLTIGEDDLEVNITRPDVENYTITIEYSGCANYTAKTITGEFKVSKASNEITVVPTNITYGQVETITVFIPDGATGNVTISVGTYTNTQEISAGATEVVFNIPKTVGDSLLNANENYIVFANYSGDNNYESAVANAPFHVDPANTTVSIEVNNIPYGNDEIINITVIGVEGAAIPSGFVTITINGTDIELTKRIDENGKVSFNVTDLVAGEYNVTAIYESNTVNYNGSNNTALFNVTKADVKEGNRNISAINITYGEDETITVILNETNITGKVTITINGTEIETKELEDGKAVFVIPTALVDYLESNGYNVVANYSGDDNYNGFAIEDNLNTDFKVDKANVTVDVNPIDIIYREIEEINVTVTGVVIDDEATGIAKYNLTGKVTIYIDDVENQTLDIGQADSNGILHFNVEGLAVGMHNVTAKYWDDRNYNENNATKDFEVINALPENMQVIPQNITYHIQDETITVDLGETLNGIIQLFINDTLVATFEVEDQSSVSYTNNSLTVGNYTAKAIFTANGDSVEATANFTVSKAPTTVTVEAEDSTYGSTQTITVTVDNTVLDKFNLTGNVSISINGVDYGNKTVDANGQAVFEIDGLEASENYVVIANYYNDVNYLESDGQDTFKVNKADVKDINKNITAINITYGEDETITVTLNEDNITGKVTITINGTEIETKDLEDGKVTFTVKDLEVNGYNVVANYSGDNNYNPFTIEDNLNADFTVSPASSTVEVEVIPSIVYGNNETITVTVPIRNHTGTITLTINGTDYEFIKHLTAEDGDTIVLTNVSGLAVGTYNVTVKYSDDRNYNDSEANALFEVTKATPSNMTVSAQNITYTEDEIIVVTVGDENATGSVRISIDLGGTVYTDTVELDENRQAKFNVTGLVVGHYTVEANYSGDANYTSQIASAPFRVDKAASNVTIEVANITYGEIEYANITIPNYNASGRVIIKVDGNAYDILPINNDTPVKLELDGLAVGTHTIDVEYFDDDNYNNSIAHAEFNVTKATIPVDPDNESSLIVVPTNITYLNNETIVVSVGVNNATGKVIITIKDEDGNIVALDESVVVSKNITEEGSQSVTFTVPGLVVGDYTVEVNYTDDANYEDAQTSAPFKVSPAASNVTVEAINITYLDDETITVSVPIVNASGTLVVKVNGTVVNTTTFDGVDNPIIEVVVPGLAVGEYNVTVEYTGDPNYNDSDASTLFHVDKANIPDVPDTEGLLVVPTNITYLDDETIVVTLDVPNATGKVTININGTDVETKDIGDGTVTFTVPGLAVGEYNVTAKYTDDPNYNDCDVSALFHVDPAASSVIVEPVNITYGEDETITVTVPVNNATGKVTITINGTDVEITKPVDSDGVAVFTVPGLVAGEYNVTAKYHDDPNYNDSEASALFNVGKANITDINVNPTNIVYGDNETITVTIGDNNATGNITIKVNGTEYGPQALEDGSTVFNIPGLVAGDYEVEVSYSGDDNYNATTANAAFTVDKATPNAYAVGTNITYGHDEQITAIVDGKNITGNVTIFIDGENITTVELNPTDTGGRVKVNLTGLSAGNHTVKVVYNGDDNHYGSEGEDNFTVFKAKPTMEVNTTNIDYGETENIKIGLTGVEGGVTPTGTVNVTVVGDNGVTKTINDVPIGEDGTVIVPVENLPAGNYNVTVNYSGDENYTETSGNGSFSVGKVTPTVDVDTSEITYGETENIVITLPEDAKGTVNVTVTDKDGNNITFTDVPLVDGKVTVPVNDLPAGDYNVTVDYSGDNNYNPSNGKADFTVDKAKPNLDLDVNDIDFHETEDITVTVTGVEGHVPTGNVTITVTDKDGNNQTFTRPINPDGSVSLSIDNLPAGDYNVTVEYPGDENYTSANATAKFTVDQIDTPLDLETNNITYGETETITVTVPDDATGNVTITIKDKDGTVVKTETVPVSEGTAKLIVSDLNAGNYTVHVDYSGDNNYRPNSTDGKFEVAKANATVEIHVYDIVYGDIEELTVTCNAPGTVTIYVNGAEVTLSLDNGYAHIIFASLLGDYDGKAQWDLENLAVGTYPARVHYNGNENYNEADDEDTFRVIQAPTKTKISVDDIKVGEDAVINVEVTHEKGTEKINANITVTVDGKEYTVELVDGKGSLTVPGLKAGEHTVKAKYPGSHNYTGSSDTEKFNVTKYKSSVKVTPKNIKVGEDEPIKVSVPKDATGKVTITVNGKKYTAPVEDGVATFDIPGLKAGNYTVKAHYSGDSKYLPSDSTAKFKVSKVKPDINTTAPTVTEGEDGTVTVTLPDDATGTVTITVDGKNYTAKVKDGKAVFNIPGLKAGKYPIKVHYSGDDKYLSSTTDGGILKVAAQNKTNPDNNKTHGHGAATFDLSAHPTGNPIAILLIVFMLLGFIPLRRKKDDEEDEIDNDDL